MTAKTIIAHDIPPLNLLQTGKDAFHMLSDYHVKHLPVVSEGAYLGLLSEEDLFTHKLYEPIGEYDLDHLRRHAVREDEHIFEVIRLMGDHRLTIIPVTDNEGRYLGLITQNDLLRYFSSTSALSESGAILVLEMSRRDYSLANICRLIEEDDVKVLSAFVTSTPDPDSLQVTLKLNRHDLARSIATLERHEYEVKQSFGEIEHSDQLRERYESLLNYLNI